MKKVQIIVEYVTTDPGSAESVAGNMTRAVELSDWSAANIYADVQDIEDVRGGPPQADGDGNYFDENGDRLEED